MAWGPDTVYGCMNMGIPGTPTLVFTQGVTFTGNIFFQSNTLHGWYYGQSIKHFNTAYEFLSYACTDETYFVPDDVIDGVVRWTMLKHSNENTMYFRFLDADGNEAKTTTSMTFYPQWLVGQTHYNWYGVLGKDADDQFQFVGDQPIDLILTADPVSNHIGITMVSGHTAAAASLGFWGADPMWVNNLTGAQLDYGNAANYIDALFKGKYDRFEGMIGAFGGPGGGGGSQYRPSYGINIPKLPTISACDTGMVSVYAMDSNQMKAFSAYLWNDNFWENIIKNFASPMDNVISMQMVPLSIYQMSGTAGDVVIGNLDTNVPAQKKLTTTYYEINCGTIKVNEYYRSFADYSPYVQMHLSLPFCGITQIDPDDCMGGYINIVYHVDVFSGACVAFVRCYTNGVWTVLQQHSGNILAQFPVTGRDYSNVYIGAINSIASLSQGNIVGAMNNAANIKPSYQRSGGVTSVAGLMGVRIPYLIISTPKYILADNYREVKGYTSNLKVKIKEQSGYLKATADNSELSGVGCTAGELELLRKMLEDGIYI